MIKFEPKYVHCFWNDELEGKKGFVADIMGGLKETVESNDRNWFGEIWKNPNNSQISYPFGVEDEDGVKTCHQFCYYDPLYEIKVAYEEGKTIQTFSPLHKKWEDCVHRPLWNSDSTEYRIKPTEEECCVIYYKSTNCFEVVDDAETVFSVDDVFFMGRKQECRKWIKEHNDLQNIVKAYYSGKKIQYFEHGLWFDWALSKTPMVTSWVEGNWRIKPEEKKEDKYVPFENTQELIEAWKKKCPANKDRPNGTMPLIWIVSKELKK